MAEPSIGRECVHCTRARVRLCATRPAAPFSFTPPAFFRITLCYSENMLISAAHYPYAATRRRVRGAAIRTITSRVATSNWRRLRLCRKRRRGFRQMRTV